MVATGGRRPARLVRRAEEHHSGDPALILDLAGQRQLIGDLLDGPAQWQALTMLEQADHRDLASLYADGGLDRLLTRKIVSAYRDRLDGFRGRLGADEPAAHAGRAPAAVQSQADQRPAGRHRSWPGADGRAA